jgi:hypothetical protein
VDLLRLVTAFTVTCLFTVAGISLATGQAGGLFWLPSAFDVAVSVAAVNAWSFWSRYSGKGPHGGVAVMPGAPTGP